MKELFLQLADMNLSSILHIFNKQFDLEIKTNLLRTQHYWIHTPLVPVQFSLSAIPICETVCHLVQFLKYISVMLHRSVMGHCLNRSSKSNKSCCKFGHWWIVSFSEIPLNFGDASNTILVLVVSFSGLITGKCVKNRFPATVSSLRDTFWYVYKSLQYSGLR